MIPQDLEAEILRLYQAEKWRVGTIARQLGVHHSTVTRALARAGIPAAARATRPSIADPYLPFVRAILEQYPKLCASRVYAMVKDRGYPGGPDHFRTIVAHHRPRPLAEAYLRLRTLPAELVHRSEIVPIEGDSYRLKEAKERAARKKAKRSQTHARKQT